MNLQRHDLVWFHPDSAYPVELNNWLQENLPCVVTRQSQLHHPKINVALSLSADKSQFSRRSYLLDPQQIIQHRRALPLLRLGELISHPRLESLICQLEQLGLEPCLFGSTSWQILTGRNYLHVGSDIDILLQISSLEQLAELTPLLVELEQITQRRVDAELVFAHKYALAWREWLLPCEQLLVKTYFAQELLSRDVLRAMLLKSCCVL